MYELIFVTSGNTARMSGNKLQTSKSIRPTERISRSFRILYVAEMITFFFSEKPESQTLSLKATGYSHIN